MRIDRLQLAARGIHLPAHTTDYMDDDARAKLAMDAQQGLVTTSNNGIPSYLTNYIDPDIVRILFAPNKGAEVFERSGGEAQKGDWVTMTATFPVIENTGEVSTYGDWNNNGSTGANLNFPQFQSYQYQTITQWGERELDMVALAKVNFANELNESSVLVLNRFQNQTYFFGIAGLQNYGILNSPNLTAPIQPGPKAYNAQAHGPWVTAGVVTATANEIYADIQSLYMRLVSQSGGIIDKDTPVTLAMSPESSIALTATNSFNVNVQDLLTKNFPNIRFVTAVQYSTTAGNVVQMIADSVEGQKTGMVAYTEKLRAHPIVVGLSSFMQKKSQGTWGAIIRQPFAIASMLGV